MLTFAMPISLDLYCDEHRTLDPNVKQSLKLDCRETRYFKAWKSARHMEEHGLPPEIRDITGQRTCSFGDAALQLNDAVLAAETCEELFTPLAPHIALALSGVEIITNGSGSHHQASCCKCSISK